MGFSRFVSLVTGRGGRFWQGLADHAPVVAFVALNALVAFGDWRIYTAMVQATGDRLAALAVVAVSALGFVLWWDWLDKYRYANAIQRVVSVLMTLVSLGLAGYGWWIASSIEVGLGLVDLGRFYRVVTYATGAHLAALMVWGYFDDRARLRREMARTEARARHQVRSVRVAQALLQEVHGAFQEYEALMATYGSEAVQEMLQALLGTEEAFRNLGERMLPAGARAGHRASGGAPAQEAAPAAEAEAEPAFGANGKGAAGDPFGGRRP